MKVDEMLRKTKVLTLVEIEKEETSLNAGIRRKNT